MSFVPLPLPEVLPARRGDVKKQPFTEPQPRKPIELVPNAGAELCAVCHKKHPPPLPAAAAASTTASSSTTAACTHCPGWSSCHCLARHPEAPAEYPSLLNAWRKRKIEHDQQQDDLCLRIKRAIDEHDAAAVVQKRAANAQRRTTVSPADFEAIQQSARSVIEKAATTAPSPVSQKDALEAAQRFRTFLGTASEAAEVTASLSNSFESSSHEDYLPPSAKKRSVSELSDESFHNYSSLRSDASQPIKELLRLTKASELPDAAEFMFDLIVKAWNREFPKHDT